MCSGSTVWRNLTCQFQGMSYCLKMLPAMSVCNFLFHYFPAWEDGISDNFVQDSWFSLLGYYQNTECMSKQEKYHLKDTAQAPQMVPQTQFWRVLSPYNPNIAPVWGAILHLLISLVPFGSSFMESSPFMSGLEPKGLNSCDWTGAGQSMGLAHICHSHHTSLILNIMESCSRHCLSSLVALRVSKGTWTWWQEKNICFGTLDHISIEEIPNPKSQRTIPAALWSNFFAFRRGCNHLSPAEAKGKDSGH